jgi:hypothetical protein
MAGCVKQSMTTQIRKLLYLAQAHEGNFPRRLFFIHCHAIKAVMSSAATHEAAALDVSNESYKLRELKRIVSFNDYNFRTT